MRRKSLSACATLVCLLLLFPHPALAWNSTGHRVVAYIAWQNMTPKARAGVTALLRKAPTDADLAREFSTNPNVSEEVRQRRFILFASTWPDVVRDRDFPARRTKYHKANWHFADFFWTQPDPNKPPQHLKNPPVPNAAERLLNFYNDINANPGKFEDRKALELAWILHLVGDVHQPLHCSGHVTASEPKGDEGGNLFCLDNNEECFNLHSYWDSIFDNVIPRKTNEDFERYVTRVANMIMTTHPKASMASLIKPADFAGWTMEGYEKAKRNAYPPPPTLERFEMPSEEYRDNTARVAAESAALAGYRLADTLNRMFP